MSCDGNPRGGLDTLARARGSRAALGHSDTCHGRHGRARHFSSSSRLQGRPGTWRYVSWSSREGSTLWLEHAAPRPGSLCSFFLALNTLDTLDTPTSCSTSPLLFFKVAFTQQHQQHGASSLCRISSRRRRRCARGHLRPVCRPRRPHGGVPWLQGWPQGWPQGWLQRWLQRWLQV